MLGLLQTFWLVCSSRQQRRQRLNQPVLCKLYGDLSEFITNFCLYHSKPQILVKSTVWHFAGLRSCLKERERARMADSKARPTRWVKDPLLRRHYVNTLTSLLPVKLMPQNLTKAWHIITPSRKTNINSILKYFLNRGNKLIYLHLKISLTLII